MVEPIKKTFFCGFPNQVRVLCGCRLCALTRIRRLAVSGWTFINLICGSCEHLGFHCTVVQVLIMYIDHELTVSQWTFRNLLCRSWLFAWTRSSRQAVSWWTSNSRTPPCPTTSSSTTSPGYTGIWNAKLFKSEKNLICSPWKDIYPKHVVVFNSFNTQIAAFVSDNIEFRWHKMLLLPGRTLSSDLEARLNCCT